MTHAANYLSESGAGANNDSNGRGTPNNAPRTTLAFNAAGQSSSLEEMSSRLEHLLEISADGMSDWDLTTNSVYVSPRWLEIMGYPAGRSYLADLSDFQEHVHPADHDWLIKLINDCLSGESDRLEAEYRILTPKGEVRWVHVRGLVKRSETRVPVRLVTSVRDVTNRRLANERLHASEERVRTLSELAPVMLWMSDANGRYLYANAAMQECVSRRSQLMTASQWLSTVHVDDRRKALEAFVDATRARRPFGVEFRLLRGDGDMRVILCSGVPRFAPDGKFAGHVGSCVDVTERKEAERALRESEERFRLLVENTSDVIVAVNKDRIITYVSPSVKHVFGFEPREVIGSDLLQHIHPDDGRHIRLLMRYGSRVEGFGPAINFRLRRRDGEWAWAEAVGNNLLHEPSVHAIVINVRDVTDRTLAEQRLRESESLYRTVFDSVSDGLRLTDADTDQTVQVNAAWCRMHGYSYEEAMNLNVKDFVPEDGFVLFPGHWLETVRAGGSVRGQSINRRKDGTRFPVDVTAQSAGSEERKLALAVVRDITEQVQAMDLLERRVAERTREVAQLLAATQAMSSTLDLDKLLQLIVDQMSDVVDHRAINLFMVDQPETLRLVAYRGGLLEYVRSSEERLQFSELDRTVVRTRQPILISDLTAEAIEAHGWRTSTINQADPDTARIRSWMCVPLVARDVVVGLVTLDHDHANYYSQSHVELVRAFANQAAAAIANARLYEAEQRRLRESERRRVVAEGLRDVLRVLNSDRTLNDILGYILSRVGELLDTEFVAIYKLDAETQRLSIQASHNVSADYARTVTSQVGKGIVGRAVQLRQPVISQNLRRLLMTDYANNPEQLQALKTHGRNYKCALAVPLMIKDECYGGLLLLYPEAREFSEDDIELARAIGDQAALAIENSRLRVNAARVAAVAERSRLARELHDSVSQALYGIALGARTARDLMDIAPARAAEPLDYVLSLVQGGLAEMRALIFELRPESLATEGLVAAFKKQADALCVRHGIDVVMEQAEEPPLNMESKEALYRIALEAIQNTIKHAGATKVNLRLTMDTEPSGREVVRFEIRDNGRGFDPGQDFPGHMGLQSMRERAESRGGYLSIYSQPAQGAQIVAVLPVDGGTLLENGTTGVG